MKANINEIMKQAQKVQGKLEEAQEKIRSLVVEGISGAGLVVIKVDGTYRAHSVHLSEDLENEKTEILEDLILAALNDAARKIEDKTKEIMEEVTAGDGGFPGGLGGLAGLGG